MPNKFLIILDKRILGLNKIAIRCKDISAKCLKPIALFIICCEIVALLGKDELENIKFLKTSYYDTVVACFPRFVDFVSAPVGKVLFSIAALTILFVYLFRWFYRQPALLIAHSTMGHNLRRLDTNFEKSFYSKRVNVGIELPSQDAQLQNIVNAIKNQDEILTIIKRTNWRSNIFYYGVAHTPLVFRLGYQIGQTQRVRFLHRFRPTEDAQEFKELPSYDNDKAALISVDQQNERNLNVQSQELVVAIATTYPITDENLRIIDPDSTMHIYNIQVDNKSYDFFSSYNKIRSYADRFAEDIRKIVKENNIQTIHIVISSSVPFVFYLAQQMNTNQYPQIIVYHFDNGKYTWGIDIKESDPIKAVTWTKPYLTLQQ